MANLDVIKKKLIDKGMPEGEAKKFLAYVKGAMDDELQKAADKRPVSRNTDEMLYTLASKYWNMGLTIDGINIVITGKNMAMVTFHGYKNKVLQTYPETKFDYGLVREGDDFKVWKESGQVHYKHDIGDPFSGQPITGAYVIFKNKRGEYFEALSTKDFEQMKNASKQSYLWTTWDSEFWLKSVMKRACKRNFNDIVAEIDKDDNEVYGLTDESEIQQGQLQEILGKIEAAKDEDELADIQSKIPRELMTQTVEAATKKFTSFNEPKESDDRTKE